MVLSSGTDSVVVICHFDGIHMTTHIVYWSYERQKPISVVLHSEQYTDVATQSKPHIGVMHLAVLVV
jgi:hypothetical protein